MKILELENEPLHKLRATAKELNIPNFNRLKKETLAMMISEAEAQKEGIELRGGILEIMSEGIGFLRATNYRINDQDVYRFFPKPVLTLNWIMTRLLPG
jgi:transcription termination factor Rho